MAVYFITGQLGGGKSLISVSRIKRYLERGLPVATNLDLYLEHLLPATCKNARVIRLPDQPTADNLILLGIGNPSCDESKNGLIVLDECGTWFNSRNWNDKGRQDLFNWLIHSRKKGWDVIFIVQDIDIIDKQARLALGELVVICRRLDRLSIPFVSFFIKCLGFNLPLPKIHTGFVRYGMGSNSMLVETWSLHGITLYRGYDTKQTFSPFYDKGPFSYLPPWYYKGRFKAKRNLRFIMRVTQIFFRKYSRVTMFAGGALCSMIFCCLILLFLKGSPSVASPVPVANSIPGNSIAAGPTAPDPDQPVPDESGNLRLGPMKRLNYLQHGNKFKILYGGSVYSLVTFPYPIKFLKGEPYARLPLGDFFVTGTALQ